MCLHQFWKQHYLTWHFNKTKHHGKLAVLHIRHMVLIHFQGFSLFRPLPLHKYTSHFSLTYTHRHTHMVSESTSHHPARLMSYAKQSRSLTNMMRSGRHISASSLSLLVSKTLKGQNVKWDQSYYSLVILCVYVCVCVCVYVCVYVCARACV